MAHRTPPVASKGRGNRRTRGGAGRHNLRSVSLDTTAARLRTCLGCDHTFKSRGPWNRFCARCRERNGECDDEDTRVYRVPREWASALARGSGEI